MLNGPVKSYFDASGFDKASLESQIEDDLYRMRTQYKQTKSSLVVRSKILLCLQTPCKECQKPRHWLICNL